MPNGNFKYNYQVLLQTFNQNDEAELKLNLHWTLTSEQTSLKQAYGINEPII